MAIVERTKGRGRYSTFSLDLPPTPKIHIKIRPTSEENKLLDEAKRTEWAADFISAPRKVFVFRLPGIAVLGTRTIEGIPSFKYIGNLEPSCILEGLRQAILDIRHVDHESYPFSPPDWVIESGILANLRSVYTSKKRHKSLHHDFSQKTVDELGEIIECGLLSPKIKTLSHGDLSMPNILLDEGGDFSGVVDLGALHIGDPMLDVAVLSWTIQENMGSTWADNFLQSFDTTSDSLPILFNRLIYDLSLTSEDPWAWTRSQDLLNRRGLLMNEEEIT